GVRDRVRAHGQPTHVGEREAAVAECGEGDPAHEHLALGRHGRAARVHVVVRLRATGEGEVSEAHGALDEEALQTVPVVHRGHSWAEWGGKESAHAIQGPSWERETSMFEGAPSTSTSGGRWLPGPTARTI